MRQGGLFACGGLGASHGALGVLVARRARHADRADDLAVDDDRHAAFDRQQAGTPISRRLAPPWAMLSCNALVGRLKLLAVTALPMAMSRLPICELSIRDRATSWPPVSTTAVTIIQPFFLASASEAAIAFWRRRGRSMGHRAAAPTGHLPRQGRATRRPQPPLRGYSSCAFPLPLLPPWIGGRDSMRESKPAVMTTAGHISVFNSPWRPLTLAEGLVERLRQRSDQVVERGAGSPSASSPSPPSRDRDGRRSTRGDLAGSGLIEAMKCALLVFGSSDGRPRPGSPRHGSCGTTRCL